MCETISEGGRTDHGTRHSEQGALLAGETRDFVFESESCLVLLRDCHVSGLVAINLGRQSTVARVYLVDSVAE